MSDNNPSASIDRVHSLESTIRRVLRSLKHVKNNEVHLCVCILEDVLKKRKADTPKVQDSAMIGVRLIAKDDTFI
jgi:hypothetical protein